MERWEYDEVYLLPLAMSEIAAALNHRPIRKVSLTVQKPSLSTQPACRILKSPGYPRDFPFFDFLAFPYVLYWRDGRATVSISALALVILTGLGILGGSCRGWRNSPHPRAGGFNSHSILLQQLCFGTRKTDPRQG